MDNVDFTLTITCPGAPFQATGKVGDVTWNYRSRHGRFGLSIGEESITGKEPEDDLLFIIEHLKRHIYDSMNRREDARYEESERMFYGG